MSGESIRMTKRLRHLSPVQAASLVMVGISLVSMDLILRAEEIVTPVLGTMNVSDPTYGDYYCQDLRATATACSSCCTDGPSFFAGGTGFFTQQHGDVSGTIDDLGILTDGVRLFWNTLPTAAYYRHALGIRSNYWGNCLDCCPADLPCRLDWTVGSESGTVLQTNPTIMLQTNARELSGGLPFSFRFCDHEVTWGRSGACGGSTAWELHLPGSLRATVISAGDSPPFPFSGTGLSIDPETSPGGVVTAINVPSTPPVPPPANLAVPRYWELETDMADGSFSLRLTIEYDRNELPAGASENQLIVRAYDRTMGTWLPLATEPDPANHRLVVRNVSRLSIFVLTLTCGNDLLEAHELCDDGNLANGDGCDINCTPTGCGNGIQTTGEACDDGNTLSDDGCDQLCRVEACRQHLPRPAGWWPGDGNTTDLMAGPSAQPQNGAAFGVGLIGQGFQLDGIDDYFTVPDNPSQHASIVTVSAWVKSSVIAATHYFIVSKNNSSGIVGFELGILGSPYGSLAGRARFTVNTSGISADLIGTSSVIDGSFHHLAGTYDGSAAMLYVDGMA